MSVVCLNSHYKRGGEVIRVGGLQASFCFLNCFKLFCSSSFAKLHSAHNKTCFWQRNYSILFLSMIKPLTYMACIIEINCFVLSNYCMIAIDYGKQYLQNVSDGITCIVSCKCTYYQIISQSIRISFVNESNIEI